MNIVSQALMILKSKWILQIWSIFW